MDSATGQALALGGAAGLLVALLARVVVVPAAFVGAAVPLVCAGGVVAERVDATIETIREHYEAASPRQQMERRRRHFVDQLNIDDDSDTEN